MLTLQIRSIFIVIMSVLVSNLTVKEAHREFNSLAERIIAKYKLLESGEFGAVGTSAVNAKSAELAVMFACMSQLCQRLNLPMPAQLHKLPFFKH